MPFLCQSESGRVRAGRQKAKAHRLGAGRSILKGEDGPGAPDTERTGVDGCSPSIRVVPRSMMSIILRPVFGTDFFYGFGPHPPGRAGELAFPKVRSTEACGAKHCGPKKGAKHRGRGQPKGFRSPKPTTRRRRGVGRNIPKEAFPICIARFQRT